MLARVALVAVVSSVFVPSAARAQAWTRDAGHAYASLSLTLLRAEKVYGLDFEKLELPARYSQTTVGLYAELGIVDRWLTASLSSELFRINRLDSVGEVTGLGDTRLGLWSGLVTDPLRVTVGAQLGIPTGVDDPAIESLPTGDGEVDVEPTVLLGWSFGGSSGVGSGWPLRHYLVAGAGYAIRTRGFADAFTYRLELGTQVPGPVLDRFWLIVRFSGVEALGRPEAAQPGLAGLGDGVTYSSPSLSLYGRIVDGLGASISADTAVRARSIAAGIPIKLAVSYER